MRRLTVVAAVIVSCVALFGGSGAAQAAPPSASSVLEWNATAVSTVRAAGTFQAEGEIYMSYVEAAVYDAVTAIGGGYRQYRTDLSAPDGAMPEAAVAAAAHRALVTYFPSQAPVLDAKYAAALAALAPGSARDTGVAVGEQAAQAIIAMRLGDVRGGSGGYSFPAPGPGVWQLPTPDGTATSPQTPWIRQLTPFMLEGASQFRPEAPDSITSEAFARDLAEVQALGGASSGARTTEQTTVARFWSANIITQYNVALRGLVSQRGMGLEEAARLLAMANMAVGDASIACWDAKYAYSFWRPVQAVRAVGDDPTWKPLLAPTPNHPEYPSAHGCVTTAFADAIAVALGTRQIDLDVPGVNPTTGLFDPSYTRHFASVRDLTSEIVDARVWAGLHYRNSVVVGVDLGNDVARYDLKRNFRPVHDSGQDEEAGAI